MLFFRQRHLNFPFTSSIFRLLSTATQEVSSSSPSSEFAVQYLIKSCGLSSDKAVGASRYITHLKSPEKADSVLRFLRQFGVSEPDIRAAALRQASFLCFNVDKCLKPKFKELQEVGFSPSQISCVLSICPMVFGYTNLLHKVRFWLQILGSVDKLLFLVKRSFFLLTVNLENSVIPNLAFLEKQCGLSAQQILRVIMSSPRVIASKHADLESKAKRVEGLGIPHTSNMFVHALITVTRLRQGTIDTRILNLKSLGFSHEEVTSMINKAPQILELTEELLGRKMEFLINEGCCDKFYLIRMPILLRYSLEKRLIPRNHVRRLLKWKGLSVAKTEFGMFVLPNEQMFVEKFVLPYESAIPGLHQAYTDACAGKVTVME